MARQTLILVHSIQTDGELCGNDCPLLNHINAHVTMPICVTGLLKNKRIGKSNHAVRSAKCLAEARESEPSDG